MIPDSGVMFCKPAVAAALAKLESEHAYGFPEFWDYLMEAEKAEHANASH